MANDKNFIVKNGIQAGGNGIISGTLAAGNTTITGTANVSANVAITGNLTVNTVTSGTWNGSVIASQYGGTGVNNGTRTVTINTANVAFTAAAGGSTVTLPASGTLAVVGSGLNQFASTNSSQLAGVISDETGSGNLVFSSAATLNNTNLNGNTTFATNLLYLDGTSNTLTVGSTTAYTSRNSGTTNTAPVFQIHSYAPGAYAATSTVKALFAHWASGNIGARIQLAKSKGNIGIHTAVADADILGETQFLGSDGTEFIIGSTIVSRVDGTPASGYVPARIVFSTMSAANTITERVSIAANGNVGIGTATPTSKLSVLGTVDITGNTGIQGDLLVGGNLTVNGTTTTINSTTISVDDKNIELGSIAVANNTTADGGGITIKAGVDGDKTLNWVSSTNSWTSSEDFNLLTGKVYEINGTSVLSATTLGAGVTGSSLTSVGTIGTGVWQGTVVAGQYGGTGANNAGRTITLGGNITTANSFTTSGNFSINVTATGATSVTLPTSGTLAVVGSGLNQFASTTSSQLAGVISDETGSGNLVFSSAATLTGTTLNGNTTFAANTIYVDASNQRVLFGSNVAYPTRTTGTSAVTAQVQIASNNAISTALKFNALHYSSSSVNGTRIQLGRSANDAIGTHTTLTDGFAIGDYQFVASDGTEFVLAGSIAAQVDGTPAPGLMPTSISFRTSSNVTANTMVTRATIAGNGNFGIGTTTPASTLQVVGTANISGNTIFDTDTLFVDATNNRVGVGTATPSSPFHVAATGLADLIDTVRISHTNSGNTFGPALLIQRDSSTPANNDAMGYIAFRGNNSAGNATDYAWIQSYIVDTTATTEDGALALAVKKNGNYVEVLTASNSGINVTGNVVASGSMSISTGEIISGTYTPTLTLVTNANTATVANSFTYMRVGSVVTVSGVLNANVTTINSDAAIGISLPIASAFVANGFEGSGIAAPTTAQFAAENGVLIPDATNDRMTMNFRSSTTAIKGYSVHFTYRIV